MESQPQDCQRRRVLNPEARGTIFAGQMPRSEQPIPDAEDRAIISDPVFAALVFDARVMPLVKDWRAEHVSQRAERPIHIRVNQQRRRADENIGRNHGGDGQSENQQNDPDDGGVQNLADRMQPRGGEPVEFLARVVDDVKRPQHRETMVGTVNPIRKKVGDDDGQRHLCQEGE